jgi:hypothetical protein
MVAVVIALIFDARELIVNERQLSWSGPLSLFVFSVFFLEVYLQKRKSRLPGIAAEPEKTDADSR